MAYRTRHLPLLTFALALLPAACDDEDDAEAVDDTTTATSADDAADTANNTTTGAAGADSGADEAEVGGADDNGTDATDEGAGADDDPSEGSVDPDTGESTGAGKPSTLPPIGADALLPWLEAGNYLDWPAESGPHESTGPHFGDVRTFLNPALFDSLSAGNDPHPVDSATVKELYGSGTEVLGWSVDIKVSEGTGGDTWYFYEYYAGTTYAAAVGDDNCTGCHGAGVDFVRTPFPLQ